MTEREHLDEIEQEALNIYNLFSLPNKKIDWDSLFKHYNIEVDLYCNEPGMPEPIVTVIGSTLAIFLSSLDPTLKRRVWRLLDADWNIVIILETILSEISCGLLPKSDSPYLLVHMVVQGIGDILLNKYRLSKGLDDKYMLPMSSLEFMHLLEFIEGFHVASYKKSQESLTE